jgi:hypothetical protein
MLALRGHFACENPKFYASTRTWPSNIGCDARQPRWFVPAMTWPPKYHLGRKVGGRASPRQTMPDPCALVPYARQPLPALAGPAVLHAEIPSGSAPARQPPHWLAQVGQPVRSSSTSQGVLVKRFRASMSVSGRIPRTRGSRSAGLIRIGPGRSNSSASPRGNPVLDKDGGCCRNYRRICVVEGVNIDRHGRMVPKVYSKLQANAKLPKASEDRWGNARGRRVDAIDYCRTCGATGAAGEGIGHRARSELSVAQQEPARVANRDQRCG